MRMLLRMLLLMLAVAITLAACGSDGGDESSASPTPETSESPTPESPTPESPTPESPTPESPTPESPTPEAEVPEAEVPEAEASETPQTKTPETETPENEMQEQVVRFEVGPRLVDCVGVGPQKCLLIKRRPDATAEFFYDPIQGFEHQAGTSYVIDVAVSEVENPPADASSLLYRLVEIVDQTSATLGEQIDGTSWTLLGFRNGDLFDPVRENVQVTLEFTDGRVNGSAGCNNYMGTFTAQEDDLSFGPLAATKKLCVPEVQQVEDRYLPLIGQVETGEWTFDDRLVLTGSDPVSLVFAPAS